MIRILTHNHWLKLLSVVLAFFVWLIVLNVSNPIVARTKDVPVEVLGQEILSKANKTYEVVSKTTVTVSYGIRMRDDYKVKASDFKVYADLADMFDVTGAIPLTVEVTNSEVSSLLDGKPTAKPGTIQISMEDMQRKRFDLLTNVTGEPEEGYLFGTIAVSPDYIYATGPVSLIGQINTIGIEIDGDNAGEDLVGEIQPVCYDANGNRLNLGDRVELSHGTISYRIPVLKIKTLAVELDVSGQVADGYRYMGAESTLPTLEVMGPASSLAYVSAVTIPAKVLNISGLSMTRQVTVDLSQYLPTGVKPMEGANTQTVVTLKVDPLRIVTFRFDLYEVPLTGARDELNYAFAPRTIDVSIQGLEQELRLLKPSDMHLSIDVSALRGGDMLGVLVVEVPEGFEEKGYNSFVVTATPKETEPETGADGELLGPDGEVVTPGEEPGGEERENGAPEPESDTDETAPGETAGHETQDSESES
ncbi:MAG: hypothetical protein LBR77_05265 [Lachnospiraceae bacterium]|jgi:YbbR domain-containing protein|nr:hypothetical protein [Lachnospiraceae bacterium]